MNVLLTGIGGFIGSHCLEYFLENTDWTIIGIDSFRHKGTYSRLDTIPGYNSERVKIFNHDLAVPIDDVLCKRLDNPRIIFNLASDSAVERSISDPVFCLRNNFDIAINMLEFARKSKPELFVQFSTDEIYGDAIGSPHVEWSPIVPSNAYAASKAAQEAVAISYWRSYDLPIIICNAMNCIAERQDPEKFLPKLIRKINNNEVMEVYGEPGNIGSRYYIHCKNVADVLIFLSKMECAKYSNGASRPDRYNIAGDIEMNNLDLAYFVAGCMGKELNYRLIPPEKIRPGYDRKYALEGSKLAGLGWTHPISTKKAIRQIVEWTLANPHWL